MSNLTGSTPPPSIGRLKALSSLGRNLTDNLRKTGFREALLPFTLFLAACQPDAAPKAESDKYAPHNRGPVSPFKNPVALPDSGTQSAHPSYPDPAEVLRAVYRKDGDGSASYEIGNGAWASYWYGHAFEKDGRKYFTGFVYSTGSYSPEDAIAGPGDQVSISQATYVMAPEGSVAVWEFAGAERDIGRFGGHEKGNAVDQNEVPVTYATPDGGYLLAVPAWYLEAGVVIKTAEIFRLDRQHRWRYLSSITTGEDNSAGCADDPGEGLPPCAVSLGRLLFRMRTDDTMPSIVVAKHGKVIEASGKTRELGPLDDREYFYDPSAARYQ